jgi:hypothetical protein
LEKYPSRRPALIDSETILNICVAASGGVRVSSIVGSGPPFASADYWFQADNVVAELKSLQKDFLSDAATDEKMHVLYNDWVSTDKVNPGYGISEIWTDQLPPECARELINVFRVPFETGILKKANRQIRETKEHLNRSDALGLLFLANDGNSALDPEMTIYILHHALKTKFSHIDHVIYFSASFTIRLAGRAEDVLPFISVRLGGRREISDDFRERLFRNWSQAIDQALGCNMPTIDVGPADRFDISQSRFKPRRE